MLYLGPPVLLITVGIILLVLGLVGLYVVHLLRKPIEEGEDFRMFRVRDTMQWLKLDSLMSIGITAVAVGGAMLVMGLVARWLGN